MKKFLSMLLAICLLAGMLTVVASAEDGVKQAGIRVGGRNAQGKYAHLNVIVVEGGGPKYLVTDEDGVASTAGATADNYNVKLEYKDGMFTVYLKGAKLINNNYNALSIGIPGSGNNPASTASR